MMNKNSEDCEIESQSGFIEAGTKIPAPVKEPSWSPESKQANVMESNDGIGDNCMGEPGIFNKILQEMESLELSRELNGGDSREKKGQEADPLQDLFSLKDTIGSKMVQLSCLNEEFHGKQQKMFLKTFVNMMDRMSNELQQTRQKLRNIDQEIEAIPDCVQMRDKMCFYRDECVFLHGSLREQQEETQQIRSRCRVKEELARDLREQLRHTMERSVSYRKRKHSLQSACREGRQHNSFVTDQQKGPKTPRHHHKDDLTAETNGGPNTHCEPRVDLANFNIQRDQHAGLLYRGTKTFQRSRGKLKQTSKNGLEAKDKKSIRSESKFKRGQRYTSCSGADGYQCETLDDQAIYSEASRQSKRVQAIKTQHRKGL